MAEENEREFSRKNKDFKKRKAKKGVLD